MTDGPFTVDVTRIEYHVDFDRPDHITLILPTDHHYGWHGCYIEVSIARESGKVVEMAEYFWP